MTTKKKRHYPPAGPYFGGIDYHKVYNYPYWGDLYWCDERRKAYMHIPGEATCLICDKPLESFEEPEKL